MRLSDFIGEATEYDKKELLEERKPKSWLKSVSAFANGVGGALISVYLITRFLSAWRMQKCV